MSECCTSEEGFDAKMLDSGVFPVPRGRHRYDTRRRSPRLYPFRGELLTLRQISRRTGVKCKTLQKRVEMGQPLDMPLRKSRPTRIAYRGKQYRPGDLAPVLGVRATVLLARHFCGQQIDAPPGPGEAYKRPQRNEFDTSVFDDSRPYIFDMRARHAMRYMARSEPVLTDDEIREAVAEWVSEEFGPTARVSDDGCAWLREQLRHELFVARNVSEGETLEFIGDLEGTGRERARQVEATAMRSFRASAQRLGLTEDVIRELRDRDARRRMTMAEWNELYSSPEYLELTREWHREHTRAELAKRSGRRDVARARGRRRAA